MAADPIPIPDQIQADLQTCLADQVALAQAQANAVAARDQLAQAQAADATARDALSQAQSQLSADVTRLEQDITAFFAPPPPPQTRQPGRVTLIGGAAAALRDR